MSLAGGGICCGDFYFPHCRFRLLTRGLGTSISPPPRNPAPAVYASGTHNRSSSCRHGADFRGAVAALGGRRPRHGRRRLGSWRIVFAARRCEHADAHDRDPRIDVLRHQYGADDAVARFASAQFPACTGHATWSAGYVTRTSVAWTGSTARRCSWNRAGDACGSGCATTSRRSANALSRARKARIVIAMNLLEAERKRLSETRP